MSSSDLKKQLRMFNTNLSYLLGQYLSNYTVSHFAKKMLFCVLIKIQVFHIASMQTAEVKHVLTCLF